MIDSERRGEEESTLDSQDLSSAASLERGLYSILPLSNLLKFLSFLYLLLESGSSNEDSGTARRNRRQRPRKTEAESNGGGARPNGK